MKSNQTKMTKTKPKQPKPIRIEDYNGIWSVSHSPVEAPKPLQDKNGEPIKSWPDKVLEFMCSDQTGLSEYVKQGIMGPVEKFIRRAGGTHYATFAFGYLHVYRLRDGETATEGDWSKPLTKQDVELLKKGDRLILQVNQAFKLNQSYEEMQRYFKRFNLNDGNVCTFVGKEPAYKRGTSKPQGYYIHVKEEIGKPKVPYQYYAPTYGLEARLNGRR